jgi:long-chain fatty acid transport protein
MSKIIGLIGSFVASTPLWYSPSLFGLGIALPDQDAFATARGNAFVATADDPAAVFYNPAGITQIAGNDISLGAYGIVYGSTYKSGATTIDSKTQLEVVPQIFSTFSLSQYHLAFGLGIYSPYGFRMEWPNSALPLIEGGELGQVTYYSVSPIVAYQVLPTLSLAAGPTINYSEANLLLFPGFDDHFRGRDTEAGYDLGVLWQPWTQHSFGVTYRSGTVMKYSGHGTLLLPPGVPGPNVATTANFHFPQTVDFGYSFRPTKNWNIEGDAEWTDWSGLKTISVTDQTVPFNWQASWILSAGVTRYLGDDWRVSGGYMYSENSVPSADFSDLVPDSDRHIFSLGVGKKCGRFSWDAAYQLAWGPSRSVTGDMGYPTANGNYVFLSHALTVNFAYKF